MTVCCLRGLWGLLRMLPPWLAPSDFARSAKTSAAAEAKRSHIGNIFLGVWGLGFRGGGQGGGGGGTRDWSTAPSINPISQGFYHEAQSPRSFPKRVLSPCLGDNLPKP